MIKDNLAVLAMLCLLGFFTWLAVTQAIQNDRQVHAHKRPSKDGSARRFPVWPDLVLSELVCALLITAVLLTWSLLAPAPLEQPANAAVSPNPAKAPWYFLGVQEMLYLVRARWAGITVLGLTVLGLFALPYLDRTPTAGGQYSIRTRRTVYIAFQSIFWLWILLLVVGVFLRGPNWEFVGLY
ncbi:MAG: hypothetical protein LLG00_11825 [Planctomycetaceae bacterium]|nr:hypothetical protein [Planctomycetaceae bacterium]